MPSLLLKWHNGPLASRCSEKGGDTKRTVWGALFLFDAILLVPSAHFFSACRSSVYSGCSSVGMVQCQYSEGVYGACPERFPFTGERCLCTGTLSGLTEPLSWSTGKTNALLCLKKILSSCSDMMARSSCVRKNKTWILKLPWLLRAITLMLRCSQRTQKNP